LSQPEALRANVLTSNMLLRGLEWICVIIVFGAASQTDNQVCVCGVHGHAARLISSATAPCA
jgi:hypothetical protein